MTTLSGDKATKFVAWLAVVSGFLPSSMSIDEAAQIFLRRCEDDEKKEAKKHGTKEQH